MNRSRLRKTLLTSIAIIAGFIILVIAFVSPIAKYLVEKYDLEYTGREIKMDWAYVNPFTGNLHFSGLEIYESNGDSIFLSAGSLKLGFSLRNLISGTYEITQITLNKPRGFIVQDKKAFNFDDLILKFSGNDSDTVASETRFNINNITIKEGEFHLREVGTTINYFIKDVNITSKGMQWDSDSINIKYSFNSGIGKGSMKGEWDLNLDNNNYYYHVIAESFDLKIIEQYLQDITNYGSFRAILDADIKSKGNFNDQENVTFEGRLTINDFHFGKNADDDYTAFDKLSLTIHELSPAKKKYVFDSLVIEHPYFKYEMYDSLDNMETMFGNDGSNIDAIGQNPEKFNLVLEIARYVKELAKNFFEGYYNISMVSINNGEIIFNDYSPSEKFSLAIDPLNFYVDSIDRNRDRVDVQFNTGFKPYGNMNVDLVINPKDSSDFDMKYSFSKFPVTLFNPYIVSYTSFPLDRGTIEINGDWKVRNGKIDSDNRLLVIDPRFTKKVRSKDNSWLPMPLIMFFVRERGNIINYKIPIKGNLKDPNFHIGDILLDILRNIFIKPPTTPYGLEVKTVENEIEKSQMLTWEMRQAELSGEEKKFIEKIIEFLEKNPEASIKIHPEIFAVKEKEHIMLFEAKKKYYSFSKKRDEKIINKDDEKEINRMSIKDKAFIKYIDSFVKDSMLFSVQEKCRKFIGDGNINRMFEKLNAERKKIFLEPFMEKELEKRVAFAAQVNKTPYNGFSLYRIEYKGEVPEFLIKAYEKMQELNQDLPRRKFFEKRRKNPESLVIGH